MADNTFANIGGHKLSIGKKYSTSEVRTGDVWIDGKPIYRKVVQIPNLPNTTTNSYAHNISNISTCWIASGSHISSNGEFYTIPYVGISGTSYQVRVDLTLTSIVVSAGTDRSMWAACVVIEYTKTAD